MPISSRERLVPLALLLALGALLPALVLHVFGGDRVRVDALVHFVGVGMTSALAATAAIALTVAGGRARDGRTVLVGTAFTAMAALLAVHGLATPGYLVRDGYAGVAAFTGAATLPVGGGIMALSTLPALRRPRNVGPFVLLQVAGVAAVGTVGGLGIAFPDLVPPVPKPGAPEALAALAVGSVFFALLLARAFKTYLLTHRRTDLAVVVGLAWLTLALPPAVATTYTQLGWWLGHLLEMLGIVVVVGAVALDQRRGRASSRPLHGDLSAALLVAEEEAFLGSRIRALMLRLAEKDGPTEGHTRRVALRAVQVGEELGLPPTRLRALAVGGLLHDIGKLSVPDGILKKPAALDDDELAVIRRHPLWGDELLAELGGFAEHVRRLVMDHHERLDGKGYPHGRDAAALALDTRILSACDVFDALVSARVYREAWPVERALALLHGDAGSAFDERCVAALERVLRREGALAPVETPAATAASEGPGLAGPEPLAAAA